MLKIIVLLALLAILTAVGATSLAFITITSEAAAQHIEKTSAQALVTSHLQQMRDQEALP